MWKKSDSLDDLVNSNSEPTATATSRPQTPTARSSNPATIGPSISLRGDLSGDEDLIIRGRVEGTVSLKQHNVTVGEEGRIKADIHGCNITIAGQMEGDVYASEQVVVKRSGHVRGNIVSPRVSLEDGCKFKGSVDMDSSIGAEKVSNLRPSAPSASDSPTAKPSAQTPKGSTSAQQGKAS